jgi:hypothetical protein
LREARAVIEKGLARELRPSYIWLVVLSAELAIEAGEWDEAQEILGSIGEGKTGNTLVNIDLRRAQLALGRGDDARARDLIVEAARVGARMDEPQFTGVLGALQAELDRREGDLTGARSTVEDALDRLTESTDDATRLARVHAAGMSVEADAAQRARDLRDDEAERDALARAGAHLAGAQAAAAGNGPLERAWLLEARAEHGRASGAGVRARGAFRRGSIRSDRPRAPGARVGRARRDQP